MRERTYRFGTQDGTELYVYEWLPDTAPTGILHVVHGMCETAERYRRFANAACDAGWLVLAHDQRGHGRTAPTPQDLGHLGPDGFQRMLDDIRQLQLAIGQTHPHLPRIILGHSMGSFLVRWYASQFGRDLAGVVLSGTGQPARLALRAGALFAYWKMRTDGAAARSPLLTKLLFGSYNRAFRPTRTPFDWLSGDSDEVNQYLEHPFCGQPFSNEAYYQFYQGLLKATHRRTLQSIPKHLPLLIFAGDRDPVGGYGRGIRRFTRQLDSAGLEQVSVKLYPGGRHEMLNETNRDLVTKDILNWLAIQRAAWPTPNRPKKHV
ncbi:alpha/beta hydrolase [Alicyclobacillus contaminans]|uniref:alpha/beta fold hydrolase n=1 Tax=Alicyclobacillus contaminans TaxID=392016 RepID=UPI000408AC1C|nr:alpha/beta hydrolase [Alicyclobacillus contaminans]GMA49732.1 alpha/beta hydrolase [Alicyclobacillus contaminans]